jgi:hypothetical protein
MIFIVSLIFPSLRLGSAMLERFAASWTGFGRYSLGLLWPATARSIVGDAGPLLAKSLGEGNFTGYGECDTGQDAGGAQPFRQPDI